MNRNIEDYIKPGARAHLVGVGGVSMAPLAEVLKGKGVEITGSDMRESGTVERLRAGEPFPEWDSWEKIDK